ncbi:MAG: hypothetical protein FJ291_03635 [Planctomycetes bacterium]|nr:hypothetical protein [Planctomycetota bacterium]
MTSYHVKVAAEAFAAGMFAHAGYDVSVQYGADQPEYDLIVAKDDKLMKVSVKGSQTGAWGLTQSYLRGANYHEAIGKWRAKHGPRTAFCLVQFKDVALGSCPRAYLATVEEIARQLNKTSRGRGETMLYEDHTWGPRASAAGVRDRLPDEWRFSSARVEHLIRQTSG